MAGQVRLGRDASLATIRGAGLTANDHCHYLGMVPIDSSLSGEFSTGSVVETETAKGLTE